MPDDAPLINLRGEKVALGPLHAGLLPLLTRWENDFPTLESGGAVPLPRAPEAVAAGWGRLIRGEREGWAGFAIYALPAYEPVGHANLRDLGSPHRTAEFGITIFDPADRGRGYGSEATRLLLAYAFDHLGVQNVLLDTTADNPAAIRAYEKAGFREIGRRRKSVWRATGPVDAVLMDCVADDLARP